MKYRVRLTAEVTDTLDTIVEVVAANEKAAGEAALRLADDTPDSGLVWAVAYEGERDPAAVDSVMLITEEDAP
jgi:hypothetical protein